MEPVLPGRSAGLNSRKDIRTGESERSKAIEISSIKALMKGWTNELWKDEQLNYETHWWISSV